MVFHEPVACFLEGVVSFEQAPLGDDEVHGAAAPLDDLQAAGDLELEIARPGPLLT